MELALSTRTYSPLAVCMWVQDVGTEVKRSRGSKVIVSVAPQSKIQVEDMGLQIKPKLGEDKLFWSLKTNFDR